MPQRKTPVVSRSVAKVLPTKHANMVLCHRSHASGSVSLGPILIIFLPPSMPNPLTEGVASDVLSIHCLQVQNPIADVFVMTFAVPSFLRL